MRSGAVAGILILALLAASCEERPRPVEVGTLVTVRVFPGSELLPRDHGDLKQEKRKEERDTVRYSVRSWPLSTSADADEILKFYKGAYPLAKTFESTEDDDALTMGPNYELHFWPKGQNVYPEMIVRIFREKKAGRTLYLLYEVMQK